MDMDVIARCDIGNGMANVLAILQYRFAITNIFQGEFMPEGNRMVYGDASPVDGELPPAGNPTWMKIDRRNSLHKSMLQSTGSIRPSESRAAYRPDDLGESGNAIDMR